MSSNQIHLTNNLPFLESLPSASLPLVYIDPPFNTGKTQARTQLQTVRSEDGDRVGFKGQRYQSTVVGQKAFADTFDDFLAFIEPRLREIHRVLADNGTLYFHIDYREVHYCKILLDQIFGRACFLNEIIWAYDYGGRPKNRWPPKHDNILVYVKDPDNYIFNYEEIERIPYMAPGLVGPEKAARGKLPTDCYSEDTDILTEGGWVNFSELRYADKVATVSPVGELSYVFPDKLHSYAYKGEMYLFETKTVNLFVTPNHKLYIRPKNHRDYQFICADEVNTSQYYALKNKLNWDSVVVEKFLVPTVEYGKTYGTKPLPEFEMGDWCEFLGWYLSEGSTTIYRDRNEVQISQIKPNYLNQIRELLTRMGLDFHRSDRAFVICNKQLAYYLKAFGYAHEKYIPREILSLPTIYLERLYEGLMLGNGNKKGNSWTYFTTSKRLANDVQELIIKLGYNSTITENKSQNPNWRIKYCVSRRISKESTIFPEKHISILPYDGMVYCCTVEPYHTLVVRRNGKVAVCGNCWWHTIVSPTGKEKTGYPTQKPLGILRRIIQASSNPGDVVADFFAGSGTTGAAALELRRRFLLTDSNPEAIKVMAHRFAGQDVEFIGAEDVLGNSSG